MAVSCKVQGQELIFILLVVGLNVNLAEFRIILETFLCTHPLGLSNKNNWAERPTVKVSPSNLWSEKNWVLLPDHWPLHR